MLLETLVQLLLSGAGCVTLLPFPTNGDLIGGSGGWGRASPALSFFWFDTDDVDGDGDGMFMTPKQKQGL